MSHSGLKMTEQAAIVRSPSFLPSSVRTLFSFGGLLLKTGFAVGNRAAVLGRFEDRVIGFKTNTIDECMIILGCLQVY